MHEDVTGKKETWLKLIIAYKVLIGLFELALAFGVLSLLSLKSQEVVLGLIASLNIDIENHYMAELVKDTYLLDKEVVLGISVGFFLLGLLAFVEAWGLHLRRRWGEWLAVIATASFIPIEIYEVIVRLSSGRVVVLIINCLIVYYLAKHKELFKGKKEV